MLEEGYREWAALVHDSILLNRQGAGAAQLYGMDTDSDVWWDAQRRLSVFWQAVQMEQAATQDELVALLVTLR